MKKVFNCVNNFIYICCTKNDIGIDMKIILGCEESQAVCIEMRERGHEAYSCDILPASGGHPEWHIQGDIIPVIYGQHWDMIIAFPPCTYLCSSGLHWNNRVPERREKTEEALNFVCLILNAPIEKKGLENSIGCISTRIYKDEDGIYKVSDVPTKKGVKASQIIQPYDFGEDASKGTCLFLQKLPLLKGTSYFEPRFINGKKRWGNQTDSGQNKLAPSENRGLLRSKTYPGIAKAMAEQWG